MGSVLIVAERALPSRGGLARATSRIATLAAARGERVHVVSLSKDAPPGGRGQREEAGVVFHPVGPVPGDVDTLFTLAAHAEDLARAHDVDLVHGIYATRAGYLATVLARRLGLASVVSVRGNDLDRGLYDVRVLPFLEGALTNADVVTGVSTVQCEAVSRLYGARARHVTNSVDADAFRSPGKDNSLVAALGLDGEVIGFSGELREKKGMRFLLPAFAELARRREVSLLLIGGVRDDAREAFEAFRRAEPEASERVQVTDYRTSPRELSRLYALCDVVVFPSLYEGTPNAVLEAMACARPILATRAGGHTDLLEHGVSGALLDLADLDRLPDALEEMLDLDEGTRSRMGAAARDRVLERHRPDDESRAWGEVYAEARARAGARSAS